MAEEIPIQRYSHVRKVLERPNPLVGNPDFIASSDNLKMIQLCRVLIVGAGGLGCELVKTLSLMGFRNIHIIDMDTIDISNLNRQFLFRSTDIGKSKAEVAAAFINGRVQGTCVVPHFCRIQDKDDNFYRQFHIVVCGLDSIEARKWINGKIASLVKYTDEGVVESSLVPIVDGGTEGFKGNARVIIPTITPCIECTINLYPPPTTYPSCTIASNPRLPEHCIEYFRLHWEEENPFKAPIIDGDDPIHIKWIYEKALERAKAHEITGVTYRLTQGVIKNIIPAVASTNAIIAAACATEVFKLVTSCCAVMDNYMVFSNVAGIYSYTYAAEKKKDCDACSRKLRGQRVLNFKRDFTLEELIDFLKKSKAHLLKSPSFMGVVNGRNKTIFMSGIEQTRTNLQRKMSELGVRSGAEVIVADEALANPTGYILNYPS